MSNLEKIYASHFYEAASYHARRVRLLQNPNFREYDEDGYEICSHAAMCVEMFITGKVLEYDSFSAVPSRTNKTRNRTTVSLTALHENNANEIDINALASLQMCGASDMLNKYWEIESRHFNNQAVGMALNSIRHYAQLLICGRNDVLHRHHMQTQSIRPISAFTYLFQHVDAVYGEHGIEHQYLAGTYFRQMPALSELLERYLNAPFDTPMIISRNTYSKQIRRIARSYTKLMQRHQYPHASISVSIVRCPKCNNFAFLINRTEAMAAYWEGEPNNSPSVLELFNPSGESEDTLRCPVCHLAWKDDVLNLYRNIRQLKYIKRYIHPTELSRVFAPYFACM